ncbi:class I SAM-dependent methyltransferase [Oscillatoria sp. CS-180]|uniref:O-methyltransferase n=1 Tax=Oscillatoria sp. CS-180 TaxID=3021720 RepID=UPI00232C5852|nr:class I SAM-dependent methyltransferase [Oscillatoria sp. CS-180]MDB9528356.1 class I SAM-dependent methyltransferase [Oscillatoria sp. CS-180]
MVRANSLFSSPESFSSRSSPANSTVSADPIESKQLDEQPTDALFTALPTPRAVTPMGILVERLDAIAVMAEQTQASASVLIALQETLALASGLDPYLATCTTPETEALKHLAQKTAAEDWSQRFSDQETIHQLEQEMLSGHVEGQLLGLFVRMIRAQRVLEVGMFTGYSALAMAEALPPEGCLIACEMDAYAAKFAQTCFAASPHGHKIQVRVAPALDTLAQLANEQQSFDLVFIDADKREYIDYFKQLIDKNLVPPGGFICVDNTLLQGEAYLPAAQQTVNGRAIAEFNRFVAADAQVEQVLLPIRDGLTVIRRKY